MKKEELNRAIIAEIKKAEIKKILNENLNIDVVNRSLNLLDKAAEMAIKNPKGNVIELAKIVKTLTSDIRDEMKKQKR
jgi:hypothetical protein